MSYGNWFIKTKEVEIFSHEELIQYFQKMREGDSKAREEIICHNLGLVYDEVKNFIVKSENKRELFAVGVLGLISSVDQFEIERGYHFSTFSKVCIHNSIVGYLKRNKKFLQDESLYQPIDIPSEEMGPLYEEILYDNTAVEQEVVQKLEMEEIRTIAQQIPGRDGSIFRKYFGFEGDRSFTQKELGKEFGLTSARIGQIVNLKVKEVKKILNTMGVMEDIKEFYQNQEEMPLTYTFTKKK